MGAVCPPGPIPKDVRPASFAVFAGVLPEDKYNLVKAFQAGGVTVGMCGDGANDAPALRQAQIGIAVSTATDVAKSAGGMVLTEPGLAGIVAAVREGRTTFQRIQNYTINSITKKIVTVLFLMVGLMMTGHAILTPLLMVIVMIAGDFLAMSLTTDNVRASPAPNAWHIGQLTIAGAILGVGMLVFCCAVLAFGTFALRSHDAGVADAVLRLAGVRQPGDDLRHPRAPASVEHPPELLAGRVDAVGRGDRLYPGALRNCHGATARNGRGGHAGRRGRVRRGAGFGEAAGFRAPRDCLIQAAMILLLSPDERQQRQRWRTKPRPQTNRVVKRDPDGPHFTELPRERE